MSGDATVSGTYDFARIEEKWQKFWIDRKTFRARDDDPRPKYYVLDMFPYPSGSGLHVGHVEGYTATDVVARYKRMRGFNVLHPMGWDAFGLPAEQYAVRQGVHPRDSTATNVTTYKRQLGRLGFAYDWDREVNTTDPKFYRWTQWIFLKLYERGLAYQSHAVVNWCPALGTVLANEEVIDGCSEVGGHPVEKRQVRQWVLKITEYAERLLADLDGLDWPESTKEMQRNWIGRSEGADFRFAIAGRGGLEFSVYSTRPDTLFGATFCVLAPEHPLVSQITKPECQEEVERYVQQSAQRSDRDRTVGDKEKTGVFTGAHAINPVNGEELPIYIADYVLMSYGSGAIMAVPGHDVRDHAFARRFGLPIKRVVEGGTVDITEEAYPGDGRLVNSQFLDGMTKAEAIPAMGRWLEEKGCGKRVVRFRLRDWIFSRQRYWGEPFPLAHTEDGEVVALREDELPVTLPELDDFKPVGDAEPPLTRVQDWVNFERDGQKLRRETNIMPQWAGSCWYYLRYLDPDNELEPWAKTKEAHWMPVDLYVGGVEHANLHLLYARFWHKVLYDCGAVSTIEPFQRILHPGTVLGENGEKMSKSRGNVVNPDDVVAEYGADSLRMFELFLGPLDQVKPWQTGGISGIYRFLKRLWRMALDESGAISQTVTTGEPTADELRWLHRTIERVTADTESLAFNTAIAALMEWLNFVYKQGTIARSSLEATLQMVAPYAPHLAEELWERLGHSESLANGPWPAFDPKLAADDVVTLPVMINGKTRGTVEVPAGAEQDAVMAAVREQEFVQKYLAGQAIRREIYVPGKIVNFVVGGK